jgi:hypothetical protein
MSPSFLRDWEHESSGYAKRLASARKTCCHMATRYDIGKRLRPGNPLRCARCFAFVEYLTRRSATLSVGWTESLQEDHDSSRRGSREPSQLRSTSRMAPGRAVCYSVVRSRPAQLTRPAAAARATAAPSCGCPKPRLGAHSLYIYGGYICGGQSAGSL